EFDRAREGPRRFPKRVLAIRRQLRDQGISVGTRKSEQGQHAVRVDRQRLSRLPDRLIDKSSIRLVISFQRMSPRPKGDFVSAEIAGAPPGGLQLLRRIDLRRDGAHDGPCYLLLHL